MTSRTCLIAQRTSGQPVTRLDLLSAKALADLYSELMSMRRRALE